MSTTTSTPASLSQSTLNFGLAPLASSSSPAIHRDAPANPLKRPHNAITTPATYSKELFLPTTTTSLTAEKVDISKPIPKEQLRPEVVELLRLTILRLQNDLETSNKRVKVSNAPVAGIAPSVSVLTPAAIKAADKAAEKKLKSQLKVICGSLGKEVRAQKWTGGAKELKVSSVLEVPEFDAIFLKAPGKLIQPTATNKPNSTVFIKSFSASQLDGILGAEWKGGIFKGSAWTQGGIFQGKGRKIGPVNVRVSGMEVSYSQGTMKAAMKFDCSTSGGGWGYDGKDDENENEERDEIDY